jgi:myo-inositol-1(or 4)-monophosphatase
MMDLSKVLHEAITLMREVGTFIAKERVVFDRSSVESKGRNDMVSYVDKTAEELLIKGLEEIIPDCGFITEERMAEQREGEYTWIIDPLDGTTNFIHDLPIYAISVALMKNSQLVLGLVFEINRQEMFTAVKGEGAFLNSSPIYISTAHNMLESLVATGFPVKDFDQLDAYLAVIREIVQHSHGIRRGGSAAVDLAYVACGRYDAFFEYNLNPWDVAAGILLIQEAGGTVTDFSGGNNMLFGKQILAGGRNHRELLQVINKHWFA